jgi:GNAT superfamily N-acetyltransferase
MTLTLTRTNGHRPTQSLLYTRRMEFDHEAPVARTLIEDDLDALLNLYLHLHPNDAPLPGRAEVERVWRAALTRPGSRYFGGFEGSLLVASCAVTVIPNLTRGCRSYAVIENVVTHRDHRRQGWGRAVMTAAMDFAWSQECYKILLLTGRKDEAVWRFYESLGFDRHDKIGFVATPDA